MSGSSTMMFAMAVGSIWLSAGVCKLYYTKRVADLLSMVDSSKSPAPSPPGVASNVRTSPNSDDAHVMLSESHTLGHATMGTLATAFGFWLISPSK